MKKGKTLRRLAAVILAGTMMLAMSTNAFAVDKATGNVTGTVTFTKTLDMTKAPGASVPDVTFGYVISGGTAVAATDKTPEILSGVGTPVIGEAEFTYEDAVSNHTVVKNVSVDFSNVTFTKPGIYRYVITENATSNVDITNDADATRYLDVYVINDDENTGNFKIANYVVFAGLRTPGIDGQYPLGQSETQASVKKGYTNTYTTYALTLDKVVTGNMGDKSREFDFTIEFEGPANATFTYGDTVVELDADGKASITGIKLADATPSKVITGIPSTVQYTITENIESKDGYITSYTIDTVAGDEKTEGQSTSGKTVTATMGQADNIVEFTNNKVAVAPTGIITNVLPYVLMVAAAAALVFVFLRKREYDR